MVIDTALDGPDALVMGKYYLEELSSYGVKFIGVYCPIDERLKRLKTRDDNLFLAEEFVRRYCRHSRGS